MRRLLLRLFGSALLLSAFATLAAAAPPAYLRTIGGPGSAPGATPQAIGVAIGPDGDVFVLGYEPPRVTRFHPDGTYVHHWDPTAGLAYPYTAPRGIEVGGDGSVYVSLSGGGYPALVRVFDGTSGAMQYDIASDPYGTQMIEPWGLAFDGSGRLLIADYGGNALLRWTGEALETVVSAAGCAGGQLHGPTGVAAVGAHYFETEYSDRLQEFTTLGAFVSELGSIAGCGQIRGYPRMIGPDGQGGLVVCDALLDVVQLVSTSGSVLESWGSPGSAPGQFDLPFDVAVDAGGLIYVADNANNRVQVFGAANPTAATRASWGRVKSIYR